MTILPNEAFHPTKKRVAVFVGGASTFFAKRELVFECPVLKACQRKNLLDSLTYAGFIFVASELVKSMIVNPIKVFYQDWTFGEGIPFKSYEEEVLPRHKNQFEACLLYLHDFMKALD